jgi:hypothetical protein
VPREREETRPCRRSSEVSDREREVYGNDVRRRLARLEVSSWVIRFAGGDLRVGMVACAEGGLGSRCGEVWKCDGGAATVLG